MNKRFSLVPENVDLISEIVSEFMKKLHLPRRAIIRGRLTVESVLLSWLEKAPENTKVSLELGKYLMRPYVRLDFEGVKTNPFEENDDEDANYFNKVIANMGLSTNFSYGHGVNYVDIKLPIRNFTMGNTVKILTGIILAFITSGLLKFCAPEYIDIISKEMISPIFNSFIALLSGVAAFMVFFNLLQSILNMGNVGNFSNIGGKVIRYIFGRNVLAAGLGVAVCSFCYEGAAVTKDTGVELVKLFSVAILNMIPSNLVQPFIEANTTQIIFLAIIAGIIILVLGRQVKSIFTFVNDWNAFFMTATEYFCAIFPFIVYLAVTSVLLQGQLSSNFFQIIKILLVVAIIALIYVFADVFLTSRKLGLGVRNYFRQVSPLALLAFSTGNAPACGELWEKICMKIGFNEQFFRYNAPLCQLLTLSGQIVIFISAVAGFREISGLTVTLPDLIVNGFVCVMIAASTAATPGGSIAVMAILATYNNLTEECLMIYIAANLFFDMFITTINMVGSLNNLVCVAHSMEMLGKNEH